MSTRGSWAGGSPPTAACRSLGQITGSADPWRGLCARACVGLAPRRYHSHPHLAVVPSHVDVRTQALYQQMDSTFIGLIFSVFNSGRVVPGVATGTQETVEADGAMMVSMHAHGSGRMQVTAFQSGAVDARGQHLPPLPPHSVSNWAHGPPADWPSHTQASSPASYVHKEVVRVRASGRASERACVRATACMHTRWMCVYVCVQI